MKKYCDLTIDEKIDYKMYLKWWYSYYTATQPVMQFLKEMSFNVDLYWLNDL